MPIPIDPDVLLVDVSGPAVEAEAPILVEIENGVSGPTGPRGPQGEQGPIGGPAVIMLSPGAAGLAEYLALSVEEQMSGNFYLIPKES